MVPTKTVEKVPTMGVSVSTAPDARASSCTRTETTYPSVSNTGFSYRSYSMRSATKNAGSWQQHGLCENETSQSEAAESEGGRLLETHQQRRRKEAGQVGLVMWHAASESGIEASQSTRRLVPGLTVNTGLTVET
eukprot:1189751-Rhodomonas_salina.1